MTTTMKPKPCGLGPQGAAASAIGGKICRASSKRPSARPRAITHRRLSPITLGRSRHDGPDLPRASAGCLRGDYIADVLPGAVPRTHGHLKHMCAALVPGLLSPHQRGTAAIGPGDTVGRVGTRGGAGCAPGEGLATSELGIPREINEWARKMP
ncbi:MAG: hypothetical protein ABIU05_18690 [Nitrospirales bacterium]